jgi:hypothetical protein
VGDDTGLMELGPVMARARSFCMAGGKALYSVRLEISFGDADVEWFASTSLAGEYLPISVPLASLDE